MTSRPERLLDRLLAWVAPLTVKLPRRQLRMVKTYALLLAGGLVAALGDLHDAISADELLLHYQPKVSIADGSLVGVEALVRWAHPTRGLLSPAMFVPAIEETP